MCGCINWLRWKQGQRSTFMQYLMESTVKKPIVWTQVACGYWMVDAKGWTTVWNTIGRTNQSGNVSRDAGGRGKSYLELWRRDGRSEHKWRSKRASFRVCVLLLSRGFIMETMMRCVQHTYEGTTIADVMVITIYLGHNQTFLHKLNMSYFL